MFCILIKLLSIVIKFILDVHQQDVLLVKVFLLILLKLSMNTIWLLMLLYPHINNVCLKKCLIK